jgi:hypothetical protein
MTDGPTIPANGTQPEAAEQPPGRSAWWVRLLAGVGYALLAVFFVGAMAFAFGSMWIPSAEQRAAYQQLRAAGRAPDYDRQFHIPIPGCVCHSDDPVKVMQHSNRRINQCMGCHG